MHIQVRTDDHIQGGESLATRLQADAEAKLARLRDTVSRVDIYVTDGDAGKSSVGGKHVVIEARPNNRPPIAVNADASKVSEAFSSALDKLLRAIDSDQGKLKDKAGRDSIRSA